MPSLLTFLSCAALALFAVLLGALRIRSSPCTVTVLPSSPPGDDAPSIIAALQQCAKVKGGRVILPKGYTYRVGRVMEWELQGSRVDVQGTLLFSDDLSYWINSCLPVDFQDQCAALRVTGSDFTISGGGFGGIDGNGQAWYTYSAGESNTKGRPISMWVDQAQEGRVVGFAVRQPQFWAFFVTNSANISMHDIYINGTNHDPRALNATGPNGSKWTQNVDGVNTYRSNNITFSNWVYQGGDDLVGIKGNSTNIVLRNITGYGGNGVAIGSLGQYPGRFDEVADVLIEDVKLFPANEALATIPISSGVYFKSFTGTPYGVPPNGGGGGTGLVRNITARNIHVQDVTSPVYIQSCLTYVEDGGPELCDTSTLRYETLRFERWEGTTNGLWTDGTGVTIGAKNNTEIAHLACSAAAPCQDVVFSDFNIRSPVGPATCFSRNVNGLKGQACDT